MYGKGVEELVRDDEGGAWSGIRFWEQGDVLDPADWDSGCTDTLPPRPIVQFLHLRVLPAEKLCLLHPQALASLNHPHGVDAPSERLELRNRP